MMLLGGREVLWHVWQRVRRCGDFDDVVVATSIEPQDSIIEDFCRRNEWPVFRGSEQDVLSRYRKAAETFDADVVVRVTSDCPLIDPSTLTKLVGMMDGKYDYVGTNYPRRTYPVGLDCEAMTRSAILRADREATDPYDREHVTSFFYRNPEKFSIGTLSRQSDGSALRLTLDTPEDFERLTAIYDRFYVDGDEIVDVAQVEEFVVHEMGR